MSVCHENHARSIAKAISYRILSLTVDTLFIYFITRKVSMTLGIVIVTNAYSTFLYYFHERLWNKSHFKRGELKKKTTRK